MKAYSMDLREEAMRQLERGLSVRKVAKNLGVHFMTIQRWKMRPSLEPTRTKPPNSPIDPDALRKDVENYPDAYLRERAERLGCSKAAIHRALHRFGISYKKNTSTSKS